MRFDAYLKVELDLSNYAGKADLKGVIDIDISTLTSKIDLASLTTKVDYLDVDKPKTVPVEIGKLSNVVDEDVIKKLSMIH